MTDSAAAARSILIVDDDPDIRAALSDVLDGEGYQVATATHGGEALTELRAHPATSLVLLDLMMPTMDGFQFRAEQMLDPAIAGIPVIVMTARGRLDPGAIDAAEILQKPLRPPILLAAIHRLIG